MPLLFTANQDEATIMSTEYEKARLERQKAWNAADAAFRHYSHCMTILNTTSSNPNKLDLDAARRLCTAAREQLQSAESKFETAEIRYRYLKQLQDGGAK